MGGFLRQSTTINEKIGPFLDKTDGVTLEVGLAGAMAVYLSKNGGAIGARNSATAIAYDADGYYTVELDTTDTNTVGRLLIEVEDAATHLPVWHERTVLSASEFDRMVSGVGGIGGKFCYNSDTGLLRGMVWMANNGEALNCTACTINIYDFDGTLIIANAAWDTAPAETAQYSWYVEEAAAGLTAGMGYYALVALTYGGTAYNRLLAFEANPVYNATIADAVWDEDIVGAHGTASTAGLLVRALGGAISTRANNATLNAILGVPDVAANTILANLQTYLSGTHLGAVVDGVWDEDIEVAHGTDATAGWLLRALGAALSNRANNATLNALLGVTDAPGQTLPDEIGFVAGPSVADIADGVWDENIVDAHGAAKAAGLLLRVLGSAISTRANNATLNALLNIPDLPVHDVVTDVVDGVWDENTVAGHVGANTAGRLLNALGAAISARTNNSDLNALLGVADIAATTIVSHIWNAFSTIPTAGQNADQVWDEARAGHSAQGSYGEVSYSVVSATAQAGCDLTHIVTNLSETTDDHYIGRIVTFISGACAWQATDITDYDGVLKVLTVTALTDVPALNDRFIIV